MNHGPETSVQGRKIVFCVTGGIAAYKVVQAVRDLTELGADVRVVMTKSATRFVGEQTFASLSGNPVLTKLFGHGTDVPHVEIARGADLAIVAPATANSIAKIAHGLSDDALGATLLTLRCSVLIVPAMHTEMWENPATVANVSLLEERGMHILGPASGALSSGDQGPGRMVEPEEIVGAAREMLGRTERFAGKRFLVSAGGTQEPIDPVRFISNRSSGRMGFTIAEAAVAQGAKVTLVSGPTQLGAPHGVDLVTVRTADEMYEAITERAPAADVIVMAAAVADFKPDRSADHKLKKAAGAPDVTLIPTVDILRELGHHKELRKPTSILVGFAAETETDPTKLADLARTKLESKGADLIVANDVASPDSGFDVRTNRAVIAGGGGARDIGLVSKSGLARALLDEIDALATTLLNPPKRGIPPP